MDLPLLNYVENELIGEKPFKDISVISCQHFLLTNYMMFEKMFNLGLNPKQTHLIGKSYSINKTIENLFVKKGVNVHKYVYDSHKSFDEQFENETNFFLDKTTKKITDEKILIIDDGAQLLKKIKDYILNKDLKGVEQTSSGYNILKDKVLDFPIINVARSGAKLNYESPFIAELVIEKLKPYISNMRPNSALVVGAGPIGENIYEQLEIKNKVIYDISSKYIELHSLFQNEQLIVGCTGKTSIPKKIHKFLGKQAILVSASSSDREFDSVYLRNKTKNNNDPHLDLTINDICLINSGFPITFDGGIHGSPPEKIQLTQALMLASSYQALIETKIGLININKEIQKNILRKYKECGIKR